MQAITQNIRFSALVFVIDISTDIKSRYGGINANGGGNKKLSYRNNIDETRMLIHRLMSEDETRTVHTLVIVFNCRQDSQLYGKIFENDTKSSAYLKKLEEERIAEDLKEKDEEVVDELAAKPNKKRP
jgi:hypothetical protein